MADWHNIPSRNEWIEQSLAGAPSEAFRTELRKDLERRILRRERIFMTPAVEQTTGAPAALEGRDKPMEFATVTPFITVVDVEGLIAFAKATFR